MYGEKHLACVQARIRAAGDHLVEITSASGALWRRALEREGRALASRAAHQALDAENGHRWLPWRTREATRCLCMALEASGFSGRAGGDLLDEIRPGWAYSPSWPGLAGSSGTAAAPVSRPVSRRLTGVLHARLGLLPSVILRDDSGLHRRPLAPEDARLHCWWAV